MQFSLSDVVGYCSCSWDNKTSPTTETFPPRFPETATKCWYQKLVNMISEKWLKIDLFATNSFVLQLLLEWLCLLASRTQASFHLWLPSSSCYHNPTVFSCHTLCHCLENLPTANNFCKLWLTNFLQFGTHAFCSWDVLFTQKWKCSSRNNFWKCSESPSHVVDQNFYRMESLFILNQQSCNVC